MRYVLAVVALAHAFGHLPGFAVPWRLLKSQAVPYRTTLLHGRLDLGDGGIRLWELAWFALALMFALLSVGVLLRSSWWLRLLPFGVGLSLLACLFTLPEARWGLAANLVVLGFACAAVRFPGAAPTVVHPGLERLWSSAPVSDGALFDPTRVPEAGRTYLQHAIAPGTRLAASVRLRMHGEIKLGSWQPFHAEEVMIPRRGMIWAGTVSMFGLPVSGADQILDGAGHLEWKLLDLISVAHGAGPDASRSGTGRFLGELAAWLPSALVVSPGEGGAEWLAVGARQARLRLGSRGELVELTVAFDERGRLASVSFPRWGSPDGGPSRYVDFGVVVEEERTFAGYTVPTRIRAGWYFGSGRFEAEGEFFRATIDQVVFK